MTNCKVYVIIVTYNAMKWIDKCFGSLRDSEVPVIPVAVDNLSKDETVDYIRTHYPEVHLIVNNKNRGFGQANNQGIEWAYSQGATHFFLLNQDAWVHPDTIGKLVEIQDKYQIALVSPIHLNGEGNLFDYGFFNMAIISPRNNKYVSDSTLHQLSDYYEVEQINAAAWMLSRRAIEKIGGFDPLFFHYGEDVNYLQRLAYHGFKVSFVPNSFIHHDRKRVGNQEMFKEREYISYLFNAYANINRRALTPSLARTKLHIWLIKHSIRDLFRGHLDQLRILIKSYFILIVRIPTIKQSKRSNRMLGFTWLDIKN